VFEFGGVVDLDFYHLVASYDPGAGTTALVFPSAGGGATLVWNATGGFWQPFGTYLLQ